MSDFKKPWVCPECDFANSWYWAHCQNPACPTNQSSAPSPRSDVGENDLGGGKPSFEEPCVLLGPTTPEGVAAMGERIREAKLSACIASAFHAIYEREAPRFGYETRAETRDMDWRSPNGRLMLWVAFRMLRDGIVLPGPNIEAAEPPNPPHEVESPEPPSAEHGTPAVPEEFTRDDMARAWEEGYEACEHDLSKRPAYPPTSNPYVLNKEVGNV